MMPRCAPTKKPAAKQPKQIISDAKGTICNWDGELPDAQFLKFLVENGAMEGLTAGQIQMDPRYVQFKQYKNSTLASTLHNAHNAVKSHGPGPDTEESRTILSELSQHTDQCSIGQELLWSGANNGASLMQEMMIAAPGTFLWATW
jgi:hypothetical protein